MESSGRVQQAPRRSAPPITAGTRVRRALLRKNSGAACNSGAYCRLTSLLIFPSSFCLSFSCHFFSFCPFWVSTLPPPVSCLAMTAPCPSPLGARPARRAMRRPPRSPRRPGSRQTRARRRERRRQREARNRRRHSRPPKRTTRKRMARKRKAKRRKENRETRKPAELPGVTGSTRVLVQQAPPNADPGGHGRCRSRRGLLGAVRRFPQAPWAVEVRSLDPPAPAAP